jgi:hypothetical protein
MSAPFAFLGRLRKGLCKNNIGENIASSPATGL